MLVNASPYLKCEIIGVSHFPNGRFPIRRKLISSFPSCLCARGDHRRRLGNRTVSFESLSARGTNMIIKEDVQGFPVPSSYEMAMEALSSLITRNKRGGQASFVCKYEKLDRMSMYLKILGLEEGITCLKIIHVAGTKGKGSTCVFCESILRECGLQTGLFTSPHLIDVRERFRINGLDISEDKFLQHFWSCWNQLKENVTEDLQMPPLFLFLTLLAFKIFICEKVDVAIIEVGLGGKEDATNVIKEPIVCGITSLGMDHAEVLGDTLRQIASHKAGILKPRVPAFTVPQPSEAMDVIIERANELMIPQYVAEPLSREKLHGLELSLSGDHQLFNAGLAVSLSKCWLQRTGNWEKLNKNDIQEYNLPEEFLRGLSSARLSGRAQIVYDISSEPDCSASETEKFSGGLIFYLDGAHSPESMEACAKWFSSAVKQYKNRVSSFQVKDIEGACRNDQIQRESEVMEKFDKTFKQVLLFNCTDVRDPLILLPPLVSTCASSDIHFSRAFFVPSLSKYTKITSSSSITTFDLHGTDLSWQFKLQKIWEKIIHGKDMNSLPEKDFKINRAKILPPHEFLYEDASHYRPSSNFSCSAVMPSLPLAIKWLRDCIKENPSVGVQVLVTGSLHLVGDVLKLLKR